MKNFIKKLSSRKLLTALSGILSGLLILFGVDAGVASVIAGSIIICVSTVTYIVVEGKLDAQAIIDGLNKSKEFITNNVTEDKSDE